MYIAERRQATPREVLLQLGYKEEIADIILVQSGLMDEVGDSIKVMRRTDK